MHPAEVIALALDREIKAEHPERRFLEPAARPDRLAALATAGILVAIAGAGIIRATTNLRSR